MKTAIMFGAGNVGRGFLGQLFHESGYEVYFVDIDTELINAINSTHSYPLHLVDNNSRQELIISPVHGILATDSEKVSQLISKADIGATAVGARALNSIAPIIAKGIEKRATTNQNPLNFIICENLKEAAVYFQSLVSQYISPEFGEYFTRSIGFVDTVIGRMVPPPTPEMRSSDPRLILVEPYKELPVDSKGFIGAPPQIVGMLPSDNFGAYTARKLYIHNCGHAILGYMGFLEGYNYGYEALEDHKIVEFLNYAWNESQAGILAHYSVSEQWIQEHRNDLIVRFKNRALGDTIFRLGRDPIRKLAPNDRLVAPARLAEKAGVKPIYLAKAIAAAYCFSPLEDSLAQELQADILKNGLESVLKQVSEISPTESLGKMVISEYKQIKSGIS